MKIQTNNYINLMSQIERPIPPERIKETVDKANDKPKPFIPAIEPKQSTIDVRV